MPIELKMPALSPTMEEGTLAKWMVKEGDSVSSGDLLAEIETDKATMEFEAVDEGTIAKILVPEGSEGVKVGAVIALIAGEGEDASASQAPAAKAARPLHLELAAPPADPVARFEVGAIPHHHDVARLLRPCIAGERGARVQRRHPCPHRGESRVRGDFAALVLMRGEAPLQHHALGQRADRRNRTAHSRTRA